METADESGELRVEDDEVPSLPQEIIVDILSRLPVKPLCRFRCVSKPWFSLISDPDFVHTHLRRTLENDDLCRQRQSFLLTFFEFASDSRKLYSLKYESIHEDNGDIVVRENGFHNMVDAGLPSNRVCMLGSCYGLVCIVVDREYYFSNPAIREYKQIPPMPAVDDGDQVYFGGGCGFGYDHVNDDFKLLDLRGSNSWIYSLRSRKWRRVENFSGFIHGIGLFLNDAFHWVISDGFTDQLQLAGFNLITETFWEWDMPDTITHHDHGTMFSVGAIKGCLCLLNCCSEKQYHFWMMTEYNNQDSWTKITIGFPYMVMIPVCLLVTGESLLLVDEKHLVLYNLEDNSHVKLHLNNRHLERYSIMEAVSYVESLISPHAYARNLQDGEQM